MSIRERVLRFALAFSIQAAQTTLANAHHVIEARLARWLLMCHDRVERDVLHLTHEFLSVMLGVRRAGVTVALHMLEGQGLIKATRGRIRVIDRGGLERAAAGLYGVPETYLIDRGGVIRWRWAGPVTEDTLRADLEPLLRRHA